MSIEVKAKIPDELVSPVKEIRLLVEKAREDVRSRIKECDYKGKSIMQIFIHNYYLA